MSQNTLTQAEMQELMMLRAEKARRDAEKEAKETGISIGASQAVVVALDAGGWPVTLKKNAWRELARKMPQIIAFIDKNDAILPNRELSPKELARRTKG